MQKVWNFGNTTLRNPNRIEQGLKIFEESFQGRLDGRAEETAFALKLYDEGIVGATGGEEKDLLGRKWCIIRSKTASNSGAWRPPIPNQGGHFLGKIGISGRHQSESEITEKGKQNRTG